MSHPPRSHQLQVAGGPVAVQHGSLRFAVAEAQCLRVGGEGRGVVPRLEERVAPLPQLPRRHLPTGTGWDTRAGGGGTWARP